MWFIFSIYIFAANFSIYSNYAYGKLAYGKLAYGKLRLWQTTLMVNYAYGKLRLW